MIDAGFAGGNERNRRYCQILRFACPERVTCGHAESLFPHFSAEPCRRRLATGSRVSNNLRSVRNAGWRFRAHKKPAAAGNFLRIGESLRWPTTQTGDERQVATRPASHSRRGFAGKNKKDAGCDAVRQTVVRYTYSAIDEIRMGCETFFDRNRFAPRVRRTPIFCKHRE